MENVALITGASLGIGKELALVHAKDHGDLVLVARSTTKLNELKNLIEGEYNRSVIIIPKDLSVPDSAQEIFTHVQEMDITIEILINNAGFGDFGLFHETDWDKEEMMINLNVLCLTQLTKLFGTEMIHRKHGKIMNLSSIAAFQPGPLMSVYYATKHYVQAFSEGIANEWKDFGVSVTALCPGPTKSNFQSAANLGESGLFNGNKLPSAEEVAKYGYQAMLDKKTVAIHGKKNALLANLATLLPRKMITNTVRKIQEKNA